MERTDYNPTEEETCVAGMSHRELQALATKMEPEVASAWQDWAKKAEYNTRRTN